MKDLTPDRLGSRPARADEAPPGWTALIAIVVLGIIGMHGIGLHGNQHADPSGLATPYAMSAMQAKTGQDAIPAPHGQGHSQGQGAVVGQGEVAAVASPTDLGHGMAVMAMLCLAMLVGAALAWTLLRSRRSMSVLLRERVMTSIRVARRTEVRQTGPPIACVFSVIRC